MSRREALLALLAMGFASATPRALAQPVAKMRRVGFITLRSGPNEYDAAFRDALRSLGHVEGRTIRIDYRWAAGNEKRADELVADLLAHDVEVIVAATAPAIRAAMRATKRIPIVMAATADPVSSGLVASLARPGGNVTGLSLVSPDTAAKRLQLLQELVPSATRIGVLLMNTGVAGEFDALVGQLEPAAQRLGVRLSMAAVRSGEEIDAALATMQRDRTHALIVAATPVSIDNRKLIAELAARHRLAAMYEVDGFVEAGGLVSYGPSLADMYKRAAIYVDKILKGAKPADLPVELPIKYDLAINLKSARALGLQLPQTLILRADRVIE